MTSISPTGHPLGASNGEDWIAVQLISGKIHLTLDITGAPIITAFLDPLAVSWLQSHLAMLSGKSAPVAGTGAQHPPDSPAYRTLTKGEHPYVSAACTHRDHAACRLTCEFCSSPCRCKCHRAPRASWCGNPQCILQRGHEESECFTRDLLMTGEKHENGS